jgi:hypothetical protein
MNTYPLSGSMNAPPSPGILELKILIHHESDAYGRHAYIAQCLNYDLVADGKTISDVLNSMQRLVRAQVILSLNEGNEPLSDFERAPKKFWELYENVQYAEQRAFAFSTNVQPGKLEDVDRKGGIEVFSLMKIVP